MSLFAESRRPPKQYVTAGGTVVMAIALGLAGVVVIQNIVGVWPSSTPPSLDVTLVRQVADTTGPEALPELSRSVAAAALDTLRARTQASEPIRFYALLSLGEFTEASWGFRLLLISIWFGALGSLLHAASSFVQFAGNRELASSWLMWYLIRPILGAGLAVIFYVVVRAGLATTGGVPIADVSQYTVAAFAALVGLFTQRATKKLSDVFDALFTPKDAGGDADALGTSHHGAKPVIESLTPDLVKVGKEPITVVVTGKDLGDDVVLRVNGATTPYETSSEGALHFQLDPSLRARKGSIEVTVLAGTTVSAPMRIAVTP